jgi:sulfide:quinone oxidoreductase
MARAARLGTLPRMTAWPYTQADHPRVLVAGGGVAALEACLCLRAYATPDEVAIDLLAPNVRFGYRPLSVLEAFGADRAWSMPLERFGADQDIAVVRDTLAEVLPAERAVVTGLGARRRYDQLLVAVGARATPHLPGATTFTGSVDARAVRRVLDAAAARLRPRIAFAVGPDTSWSLPLYELALLAAADLAARGARAELTLVTSESAPLQLFGARAGELVATLLSDHGVSVVCDAEPLAAEEGELRLADGRSLPADEVVALPRAAGRFVTGLPHDAAGFIPVDAHGLVEGMAAVRAAGDITTFPFKQGGLATQAADAAAEAILAELGFPIEPRPFSPVLQGVLYSDGAPAYLRTPLGEGADPPAAPRSCSLWWPPSKIAGRFLSPYLTIQAGAPRAPELRPSADIVPVHVDLGDARVRGNYGRHLA